MAGAAQNKVFSKGMATSISEHASVFLPGHHPPSSPLKVTLARPQSIGSQRVGHYQSDPAHISAILFFYLWKFCPVTDEHQCGTDSWLVEKPSGPKCAGTRTASVAGVMPYLSFFQPLVLGDQEASLGSLSP